MGTLQIIPLMCPLTASICLALALPTPHAVAMPSEKRTSRLRNVVHRAAIQEEGGMTNQKSRLLIGREPSEFKSTRRAEMADY